MTFPIKPWQVWWANLTPTEGREQDGRRPVVVVSSPIHLSLTGRTLATIVPLTTRERPGWLHRVKIGDGPQTSWAITEQVRTISAARLVGAQPAWILTPTDINKVRRALTRMVDL